jgi:hypothetical protein
MNAYLPILAAEATQGQFLINLLIGIVLGCIGQIARAAIGIKKENDKADADVKINQLIDGKQLAISLLYGAAAGGIAAVLMDGAKLATILNDKSVALTIISVGYAGADFLEGIITKATGETNKIADSVSTRSSKISELEKSA